MQVLSKVNIRLAGLRPELNSVGHAWQRYLLPIGYTYYRIYVKDTKPYLKNTDSCIGYIGKGPPTRKGLAGRFIELTSVSTLMYENVTILFLLYCGHDDSYFATKHNSKDNW